MKKVLAIVMSIVLIAGIVCAFASCGGNGGNDTTAPADDTTKAAATSDLAYIKDKGTMVIGITDYAPMNYKDDAGNWTGFDTEFAELVCKELGVKAEFFVLSDWDQKVNELNSKAIDVVWNGMTITDELKKSMSISDPYVINAQVIVTKAENAEKYVDLESIKDATIAVETGSAGAACVADCANVTEVADELMEVKNEESETTDAKKDLKVDGNGFQDTVRNAENHEEATFSQNEEAHTGKESTGNAFLQNQSNSAVMQNVVQFFMKKIILQHLTGEI